MSGSDHQLVHIIRDAGLNQIEPLRRKRFWLQIGHAFSLRGLVMLPIDSNFEILLQFYSPNGQELDIKPLVPISWEPAEPYRKIPRALRYDGARVDAVFIEIQHTGQGRPCWETHALEGHHAKQNHQPKGI